MLAVNRRCDMADGKSGGRLGESFSPTVSPPGCKCKVTAVIKPFSLLFILQIFMGRVFTEGHKYTKFHFRLLSSFFFFCSLQVMGGGGEVV